MAGVGFCSTFFCFDTKEGQVQKFKSLPKT